VGNNEQFEPLQTVAWSYGKVRLIDQTALPDRIEFVEYSSWHDVVTAIQTMVVRGAPAIGCTAALGMALGCRSIISESREAFKLRFTEIAEAFRASRPTAVNLFWAIDRMTHIVDTLDGNVIDLKDALVDEALKMLDEDIETNRRIGWNGAELLPDDGVVLTHCNAGALATVGYGTALGVIRAAVADGKKIRVYADETRPRLQGMKLTAWELAREGIDVTVIADSMAAVLMKQNKIDCVVVGADRIAANGDTANKIGTYGVAVLARHHGIPFYVAAPYSTIDFAIERGEDIPIEERSTEEMTHINGVRIMPIGVPTINPAFDVTPGSLVTAFITECGVIHPPYTATLRDSAPHDVPEPTSRRLQLAD
jgi:methylthioribose-1-phosphate isomerase